ncbi:MAG: ketoacyl-ACP synthase III [Planctomycetes bacterium]|nr:ketoacyl-ACP synthase III [Planctomycetota bacterium]
MNRKTKTVLRGTGSCLPSRIVANDEFVRTIDTSDEWIRTRTGIHERRFASPGETSATLAIAAARKALSKAKLDPHEIDLIICATITPDMMSPANACTIQAALGCRQIPAFDISAACTGFIYAMSIGDQFIRSGTAKNVLIVGTEVLSRAMDFTDRNTCILFGDGAGAAVLSASDQETSGIQYISLYSDGVNQNLIQAPARVIKQAAPGEATVEHVRIHGREVFRFAVYRMVELIQEATLMVERLGLKIDLMVPHQVNRRIIDSALSSTGFPVEKVMINLDRYGNTSAASVPIALDGAIREGRAKPGDTVLLVAFGGGLTWGSAIVTL